MARCSGWPRGLSSPCWTAEAVISGSAVGPLGRGVGPPICFFADAGTNPEPGESSPFAGPAGVMPGELITVRRFKLLGGLVSGATFDGEAGAPLETRGRQPDGLGTGAAAGAVGGLGGGTSCGPSLGGMSCP